MAITVVQHDASEARKNHPGLGPEALPPIAGGMSVAICSPAGPVTRHLTPLSRTAVAGACFAFAFSGWPAIAWLNFVQRRTNLGIRHADLPERVYGDAS